MLFAFGYVLAGAIIYEKVTRENEEVAKDTSSEAKTLPIVSEKTSTFGVKEGFGSLELPLCELVSVQLAPSKDKDKATLTLYMVRFSQYLHSSLSLSISSWSPIYYILYFSCELLICNNDQQNRK